MLAQGKMQVELLIQSHKTKSRSGSLASNFVTLHEHREKFCRFKSSDLTISDPILFDQQFITVTFWFFSR